MPSPPPAPVTSALSPAASLPTSRIALRMVPTAQATIEASCSATPSGTSATLSSSIATYSRIAADHAGIAGELAVGAQRLASPCGNAGTSRRCDSAARSRPCRRFLKPRTSRPVSTTVPEISWPRMHRHLHAELQGAVARHDVVEAHAAGIDLDDDVLAIRRRVRDRLHLEHVGAARRPHHHRLHSQCPFGLNFSKVTSPVTSSNTASTGMPMRSAPFSTPAGLANTRTPQSSRTWIDRVGHRQALEVRPMEHAPRLQRTARRDRDPFAVVGAAMRAVARRRETMRAAVPAALHLHLAAAQRLPERLVGTVGLRQRPHDGSLP